MDPKLTVACALIGTKWPDVWVHRLHRMVEEHCSVPFDFKVITDRVSAFPDWGVPFSREIVWTDNHHSRIPNDPRMILNRDKPQGCWAKTDVFQKGFANTPIICLDLDIVILDDIAPLASDKFGMAHDGQKFNGSVYSFTESEATKKGYADILPLAARPRGEQEWVADQVEQVHIVPDCYSFKLQVASRPGKEPPPGTRIVYFHGMPTPASKSVQDIGWISRTWKGLEKLERI